MVFSKIFLSPGKDLKKLETVTVFDVPTSPTNKTGFLLVTRFCNNLKTQKLNKTEKVVLDYQVCRTVSRVGTSI